MKRKGIDVTKYPFNTKQGNIDLMLLKLENKSLLALPYYLKSLNPVNFASYINSFFLWSQRFWNHFVLGSLYIAYSQVLLWDSIWISFNKLATALNSEIKRIPALEHCTFLWATRGKGFYKLVKKTESWDHKVSQTPQGPVQPSLLHNSGVQCPCLHSTPLVLWLWKAHREGLAQQG